MLDLVRLSRRRIFPPGGPDLFRQVALLTGMREGDEVLDVACGLGVGLERFVVEYGVHGQGVDHDPRMVERAEAQAKERGLASRLQFQHARPDRLPYRDRIFDVVVGELGLTARAEPQPAVRELARVAKPGGAVVLIQLVWKAPVDLARSRILADHLGVTPLMLVEWKRLLREAGIGNLHTEDWSQDETAFRSSAVKPFPDFAELFSIWEKLGILRRARRRWGWEGVLTALVREREVHRLLTRERILGLDLVKGTRSGAAAEEGTTAGADAALEAPAGAIPEAEDARREAGRPEHPAGAEAPARLPADPPDTDSLPLFRGGGSGAVRGPRPPDGA